MKEKMVNLIKSNVCVFLGVFLFSLFVGIYQIRALSVDLEIPVATSGDGMQSLMYFKGIEQNGLMGNLFNGQIGAPDVSALLDSPCLDWSFVIIAWVLTFFSSFIKAQYLFYILTFVLAGISMYILLCNITKKKIIRFILSCAYVITPYHFYRGMGHMTLSNCFCIPIGILLAITIYRDEFSKGVPVKWNSQVWKKVMYVFSVFLIGISNVYYVLFTLIICGLALVAKLIREKTISKLYNEALPIYGIIVATIFSLLPKIAYAIKNGSNVVAANRGPWEAEIYGLKIIELFLPPAYSRVNYLSKITNQYLGTGWNINENYFSALGLIATIGFLILCIHFIGSQFLNRGYSKENSLLVFLEVCLIALLLYCTSGGFGTIFSYVIMSEFRGLNRVSIMIVAICLTGVALAIEQVKEFKLRMLFTGVLIVLFGLTCFSEIPSKNADWQSHIKVDYEIKKAFFESVESELSKGDMIYQLPYVDYPEVPTLYQMGDYSHFMGYVFTDDLRWSYGGVKGRNESAKKLYIDEGKSKNFVDGIKNSGFSGVYIDGFGYEDGGVSIVSFYKTLLNKDPIVSDDNRLFFFELE